MLYFEHTAFLVDNAKAVADWWCENLGMEMVRYGGPPSHMTFLRDASGKTMFEIYENDTLNTPEYVSMHVSILHFAFYTDDIEGERDRLLASGATLVDDVYVTDAGDQLAMLRDPWGVAIQVLKRKDPMV
jgi:glyoxylase I family protein